MNFPKMIFKPIRVSRFFPAAKKRMLRSIGIVGAFFAVFLAIAADSHAETVDRVVAVVNNQPITLYELDHLMAERLDEIKNAQGADQKQKFSDYRQLALQKLIEDRLFEEVLKKRQITVSDDDVEKALDGIMKRNNMTEKALAQEIAKKGKSMAAYKADLKEQIKKIKFIGQVIAPRVKVTDADLDEFFAKHPEKFASYSSVKMAQIIIPLSPTASDNELQTAQSTAQEVVKKAKSGANFEDLGKKYSSNPNTAVAADYSVRTLAPQIVEVLSDLQPNQIGDPVRSEMGLHIVKLFERSTLEGEEYKQVKEQIRERIFEEKVEEEFQKYLDELKSKAFIVIKSGGPA